MKLLLFIFTISLLGCRGIGEKQDSSHTGLDAKQVKCVERIFKKDSVLGDIRNHASEKMSLSQAINNYTSKLEAINYNDCPEKFTSAFLKHIEAWKLVKKVTDKYPSMRGELHDIFAKLEKSNDSTEFKILAQQIWDTWDMVKEHAK